MLRKYPVHYIVLLSLLLIISIRWLGVSGQNYRTVITSDGRGYYHYFVALLGPQLMDEQEVNGTFLLATEDGSVLNKYFAGTALLWSPFVLPVYAWYYLTDGPGVNFYAEGFQKAISLAALLYLFLGLLALKKLLESFDLEARVVNITLFVFFFGTNLSYYTIIAPSMSHVYSFSLIAGFLYFVRRWSLRTHPFDVIFATLILGLLVLVRPLNILIVLAVPVIWARRTNIINLIKDNVPLLAISAFFFLMIIGIQMILWYFQSGKFIQWSYSGEGFYFYKPHFFDFIFSFRKGFLIYTPLLLLSLKAIPALYRKERFRALAALFFVTVLIYVLSSWWNWYYGDSYASRALIDFYAFFALLFALDLQQMRKTGRLITVSLALLLTALNVFQSYQYYHNIMSHYDMTREKYAFIFLKGGEQYEHILGGNDDIAPYHKKPMKELFSIPDNPRQDWYQISCTGGEVGKVEQIKVYGAKYPFVIDLDARRLMDYRSVYFEMKCDWEKADSHLTNVYWTISMSSGANQYYYYAFRINAVPVWQQNRRSDTYRFSIPKPKTASDKVIIGLWNKGEHEFTIRKFSLKAFGITN
jgi:hypothetical protein